MGIECFYTSLKAKGERKRSTRVCYESARSRIIVEDTSGWRQLKRGEQDAGLLSSLDQVLVSSWRCEICGIGIGPGYNQECMYLYPVYHQFVSYPKSDTKMRYYDHKILKICGECAAHPNQQLPEWLCVLTPDFYSTTTLLCREEEAPTPLNLKDAKQVENVRLAIEEYIDGRRYIIFLLHLFFFNVSFAWFFSMMAAKAQEKKPHSAVATTARVVRGLWKHIVTPPVSIPALTEEQMQQSLDQLYGAIRTIEKPAFPQSALFS